jgi:hypothetical protein
VTVDVQDAGPNTTFAVIPGGGDATIDGVCSGTVLGQVVTLNTSSGGGGAVELERTTPNPLSVGHYQVMLRGAACGAPSSTH